MKTKDFYCKLVIAALVTVFIFGVFFILAFHNVDTLL